MTDEFDFIVIGGGSAGYAGAATAVRLGLRTAVIECASEVGGLCILRGCMPSKTLIESGIARRRSVGPASLDCAPNTWVWTAADSYGNREVQGMPEDLVRAFREAGGGKLVTELERIVKGIQREMGY